MNARPLVVHVVPNEAGRQHVVEPDAVLSMCWCVPAITFVRHEFFLVEHRTSARQDP